MNNPAGSTLTSHQLEALDFSRNIALTANAGSGKTFVLSIRFLEILLSGNIPLRKVAAITFTEKAASELYKKIAFRLEEMISGASNPADIEKLQGIRRSLVSANISTIHSFCINLLKEYPVEAQLDANFTPIDPLTSSELIEASVDEVTRTAISSPEDSPKIKALIRLFASRGTFMNELIQLVNNRKNILQLKEKLYSNTITVIASEFYSSFLVIAGGYISKHLPRFISSAEIFIGEITAADKNNKYISEVSAKLDELKTKSLPEEQISILCQISDMVLTGKGEFFYKLTRKIQEREEDFSFVRDFLCECRNFRISEDHHLAEKELAVFGLNIIDILDKCLVRYEEKKKSKGYLDFEDILLHTKRILEDEQVRESVWKKFDYIMIDEYQDTNEIQYEIFLPILDYLKRGNLFVVGDEKQSIYMFRDAELEVFERTRTRISSSVRGKNLLLPDSFRMSPAVCLFTNYIFSKIFIDPDSLFNEVAHSELVCARRDDTPGGVEFLFSEPEKLSEAVLVSRKILELKNKGIINWNDAAVLTRKRKSFDELEEAFVSDKIPYQIVGGRNFYQRQPVYDIYNYFAFLLDTNNDGALAGILRSPFFNLSDAKLYEISLLPGLNFYEKLRRSDDTDLVGVKQRLSEMLDESRFADAPELLRKMLGDSSLIAFISSSNDGSQETANIRKLMRITVDFYAKGFRTLYDYVTFLRKSIERTEDESQAVIAGDSNTVKIMTIHQAKGLEFPAVFIFRCGDSAQRTAVKQKSIVVDKNLGILTKVPLNENYYEDYSAAPVVNLSNFISGKKNTAEIKRLFYVAVTRAKDLLFITSAKRDKYPPDSFTAILMNALADDFRDEGFCITGGLKFLIKKEEKYIIEIKDISVGIRVTSDLELTETGYGNGSGSKKQLRISPVEDTIKDEMISATRYSVYKQCPLKYKFTYVDGLLPVINAPVYTEDPDTEKTDRLISGSASVKGRIIHRLLQKSSEHLESESIAGLVLKEDPAIKPGEAELIAQDIISDLAIFFRSRVYNDIKGCSGLNEYEVYLHEEDYYLFGIIDKLIIDKDRITIIDYKTDDIPEEKTSERAEEYFNQLKFYSYIIWNTFNNSYRVFFRIIFIKHPDKYYEKEESPDELLATGANIREMIKNTRDNIYTSEKNYCRKCIYSSDHVNCIKKQGQK